MYQNAAILATLLVVYSAVSARWQSRHSGSKHGDAELICLGGLYCLVSVTLNGFDVPVPEPDVI